MSTYVYVYLYVHVHVHVHAYVYPDLSVNLHLHSKNFHPSGYSAKESYESTVPLKQAAELPRSLPRSNSPKTMNIIWGFPKTGVPPNNPKLDKHIGIETHGFGDTPGTIYLYLSESIHPSIYPSICLYIYICIYIYILYI